MNVEAKLDEINRTLARASYAAAEEAATGLWEIYDAHPNLFNDRAIYRLKWFRMADLTEDCIKDLTGCARLVFAAHQASVVQ